MSRLNAITFLAIAAILLCSSCNERHASVPRPARAVYFWSTTWQLDDAQRAFLHEHSVKKVYMRYFDVVRDSREQVVPNATIEFKDSIPDGIEVVPTIFIVENCFEANTDSLATRIVRRVLKINSVHHIPGVKELQIDCDWTRKSEEKFFRFLTELRGLLKEHGMGLSATIRLHQLATAPPPVDYGALMVYNTGDLTQNNGRNPILDRRDVMPYVDKLNSYKLPLCAAYPSFAWHLLFHGNEFRAILYDVDLGDTITFAPCGKNRHLVTAPRSIFNHTQENGNDIRLSLGDSVLTHLPTAQQVLEIHDALESKRKGINRQVIIYCLSNDNINNYKPNDYEKMFSP